MKRQNFQAKGHTFRISILFLKKKKIACCQHSFWHFLQHLALLLELFCDLPGETKCEIQNKHIMSFRNIS